jgi:phosphoribosylaminoimidazole-succinocarboxamide synthase
VPATNIDKLELLYQGSVKRVFASKEQAQRLYFEFTDDYSVFDWGKMPDTIANKGRALTLMGAHFFCQLADPVFWRQLANSPRLASLNRQWLNELFATPVYRRLAADGMSSHYLGLRSNSGQQLSIAEAATTNGAVYMEVKRAEVVRPLPTVVMGQPIYYYPPVPAAVEQRLVPLEVVFRFGMPAGSSLKERLAANPDYALQLGLETVPAEGTMFDRAVIEFFTKLEPKDRLLSVQEALLISGLPPQQFIELTHTVQLAALALFEIFGERAIELWDGKFEFILDRDQLLLADSIGPDELRLIYQGFQLSKEMIRQVYRGSRWEKALKEAQKLAKQRGSVDWKTICRDELQALPDALPAPFKSQIDRLYPVLTNHIVGQSLFAQQPELAAFAASLHEVQR